MNLFFLYLSYYCSFYVVFKEFKIMYNKIFFCDYEFIFFIKILDII